MPNDGESGPPGYLEPYRRAVDRHGATFEATLWHSREKQRTRFAVIAGMRDPTGSVIVDAGCGLGDYAAWLAEHDIAYGRYVGIEAMAPIAEAAAARGLDEAVILVEDFIGDEGIFARIREAHGADLVVLSGSLNAIPEDQARAVLGRAWDAAAEGVVFNFLSSRHHRRDAPNPAPAIRFDPLAMLDFALARTPNVRFRQDYMQGHDATIAMLRPEAGRGGG